MGMVDCKHVQDGLRAQAARTLLLSVIAVFICGIDKVAGAGSTAFPTMMCGKE